MVETLTNSGIEAENTTEVEAGAASHVNEGDKSESVVAEVEAEATTGLTNQTEARKVLAPDYHAGQRVMAYFNG